MARIVSFIALLLVAGCAGNPYAKFYQGAPDARTMRQYEATASDVQVYSTDNFQRDVDALKRKGYTPIGQAFFSGAAGNVTQSQLIEQAKKIGAHVVLASSKFTHTVQGALPLSLPQTSTSYTTGQASAYGPGGVVNATGSATTTTYGTQTVMMPYTIQRADFGAVFLVKIKQRVGIEPAELDDATRKRLQTNSGIRVRLIVEGTSAFEKDILPDDVLLAIAGESVQSPQQYNSLLNKYEGQTVTFRIDRAGTSIEKEILIKSIVGPPGKQ